MKIRLVILILLINSGLYGQYLVVTKNANIYEESNIASPLVRRAVLDEKLPLLDSGVQSNGYFHVELKDLNRTGWIYRTLVRRFEGPIPGTEAVTSLEDVIVRVIDVGAGLCTILKLPGNKWVIYDAGHYRGSGNTTFDQIREFLPSDAEIDLLILSHTDADHMGAAGRLLREHKVRNLVWTGLERSMVSSEDPTETFIRVTSALSQIDYNINNVNLNKLDSTIKPGIIRKYGDAQLTFLCGFGKPLPEWGLTSDGEQLNSVSIVVKLEYKGSSVLFTGDAVGRHDGDPEDALIATEKYLVDNAAMYLDTDILFAPHHGGDNASSTRFIQLTTPQVVIFSAGHHTRYQHPRNSTALRYLNNGVDINNIFKTDRGDNEGGKEWSHESIDCDDPYDDDSIFIILKATGGYQISYLNPNPKCDN